MNVVVVHGTSHKVYELSDMSEVYRESGLNEAEGKLSSQLNSLKEKEKPTYLYIRSLKKKYLKNNYFWSSVWEEKKEVKMEHHQ